MLELPDRQPSLDGLDDIPIRLVRVAPMRRGGDDDHRRLADGHRPDPVDDRHRAVRPALASLGRDLPERRLRHLGIRLVLEADDLAPVVGAVAGATHERDDRAVRRGRDRLQGLDIDRFRTEADRRLDRPAGHRRQEGDLVAIGQRLVPADRDPVAGRLGEVAMRRRERGSARRARTRRRRPTPGRRMSRSVRAALASRRVAKHRAWIVHRPRPARRRGSSGTRHRWCRP